MLSYRLGTVNDFHKVSLYFVLTRVIVFIVMFEYKTLQHQYMYSINNKLPWHTPRTITKPIALMIRNIVNFYKSTTA